MSEHTELDAFIASLNIKYTWRFVPQAQSRNAGDKRPTLNWIVTLQTNPHCSPLQMPYMQGIAHVPGYNKARSDYDRRMLEGAAHSGKAPRLDSRGMVPTYSVVIGHKPLPPPALRDILYSLVLDASAIDCATFEDWAAEYGYEVDSRKAEGMYQECLRIGLQLRAMLGNDKLEQLRNLLQDY